MCFGGSCETGIGQVFSHHDACPLYYVLHEFVVWCVCLCVFDGRFLWCWLSISSPFVCMACLSLVGFVWFACSHFVCYLWVCCCIVYVLIYIYIYIYIYIHIFRERWLVCLDVCSCVLLLFVLWFAFHLYINFCHGSVFMAGFSYGIPFCVFG